MNIQLVVLVDTPAQVSGFSNITHWPPLSHPTAAEGNGRGCVADAQEAASRVHVHGLTAQQH
jgi:hypothetical protein